MKENKKLIAKKEAQFQELKDELYRKLETVGNLVHASVPISNDEVFISYGKKSNGELLLSYGFVPKEGTNPSDLVELSLSLKKSDKCYKEKLEALRKYELSG
nr:serine--trna ligase [Quercus suber]